MNTKQIFRNIVSVAICVVVGGCQSSGSNDELKMVNVDYTGEEVISFAILFDNEAYKFGDEIKVQMILKNKGSDFVLANGFMLISPYDNEDISVKFNIKDPFGNNLRNIIGLIKVNRTNLASRYIVLEPNEEYILEVELNKYYDFSKEGEYFIQAIYNNSLNHPDGIPAWKGTIESNIVTLVIVP